MKRVSSECWTFSMPTALGIAHATYEFADDSLRFMSDDPLGPSETVPWSSIDKACTAGPRGCSSPDLPNGVPSHLEWLLLARTEGGGKPFMRALPQGAEREEIVTAMQARLGPAWIGARLPLEQARQRLGIAALGWSTFEVVGIALAVLALLILLLVLIGLLLQPAISLPAGLVLGAWLIRKGLGGQRDAQAMATTSTVKAGGATLGPAQFEGRAVSGEPTVAAVTGRPSVWWDVAVYVLHEDDDRQPEWRQVAARHGGRTDLLELQDESAILPVWLHGATVLLDVRTWDSSKDSLPAPGLTLLAELGLSWCAGNRQIMITEECLEVGQTLFVHGTLDERRHVLEPSQASRVERGRQLVHSGQWRRELVGATPAKLRVVVASLISALDMVTQARLRGERPPCAVETAPPAMAPDARLVWKGRAGRPFLVSNGPQRHALEALHRRSSWTTGLGAAVVCFALYQVVEFWN